MNSTLRIVDRPIGHRMGFLIHTKEHPDYDVHFSMWEWGRFLDLILWSNDLITLDELKESLTKSNLKESNAKAGQLGIKPIDFDLDEWAKKVKVERGDTKQQHKSIINVHATPDATGRNIYEGVSQTIPSDVVLGKEAMNKMVQTAAISLSVFQELEDKMFYNKDKLGHLYGIQGNEFDFTREGCWEIYNTITSLITGDIDFLDIMEESGMPPLTDRHKKRRKSKDKLFLKDDDSIVGEYIPKEMLGKIARLNGIIINGIVVKEQVIVR